MQVYTIQKNEAGQRFDKFLKKYFPEGTTSFFYKMLRKKNITRNHKKAEGNEILAEGDTIETFFADETYAKMRGITQNTQSDEKKVFENDIILYQLAFHKISNIEIVYEDNHILLCNKPAGVLSQKASADDVSMNEWLIGYLLDSKQMTQEELRTFKPSICNRLDRNTSGLLICGKSLLGSQVCSRVLQERSVHKFYYALSKGTISKQFAAQGYLIKDTKANKVRLISSKQEGAERIDTEFTPLANNAYCTLLKVLLITGKPHQIRAHLASLGHPIIGDPKYGSSDINQFYRKKYHLNHQLLHAYELTFPKDISLPAEMIHLAGKTFTAPLPNYFQEILEDANLEIKRS